MDPQLTDHAARQPELSELQGDVSTPLASCELLKVAEPRSPSTRRSASKSNEHKCTSSLTPALARARGGIEWQKKCVLPRGPANILTWLTSQNRDRENGKTGDRATRFVMEGASGRAATPRGQFGAHGEQAQHVGRWLAWARQPCFFPVPPPHLVCAIRPMGADAVVLPIRCSLRPRTAPTSFDEGRRVITTPAYRGQLAQIAQLINSPSATWKV